MNTDGRRRFTIADGMILIAATAFALVAIRATLVDASGMTVSPWAWAEPRLTWVGLAFTLAFLPIRLRRPRPDRAGLWRQPGWVACVSVMISLLVSLFQQVLSDATLILRRPVPRLRHVLEQIPQETLLRLPMHAVIVIVATWIVLHRGGQWNAEPGWVNRSGRAIAVYWVVINLLSWISVLFL